MNDRNERKGEGAMRPWRSRVWPCALALWMLGAGSASAAWNSVFQVCCQGCGAAPTVSHYLPSVSYAAPADPCCAPPQPVCTTRYVQRSYYQPVTSYQTRSYYEAVTNYRTSYYYEPVTTYRYSCYVDPCTGCSQQMACPTTSYQLRSQSCPVQSWVQRCCQVPVTSYQQAFYYEPVTSCCTPQAPSCPTGYAAPAAPAVVPQGPVPGYQTPAPPAVSEQAAPGAPGVGESRQPSGSGSPLFDRSYYGPGSYPQMPPATNSGWRQVPQRLPAGPAGPGDTAPRVRLDRIVTGPAAEVRGRLVDRDQVPRVGARLVFVSTARGGRRSVTADASGQFRVILASGEWLVYTEEAGAQPRFHSRIDLQDNQTQQMMFVSR